MVLLLSERAVYFHHHINATLKEIFNPLFQSCKHFYKQITSKQLHLKSYSNIINKIFLSRYI